MATEETLAAELATLELEWEELEAQPQCPRSVMNVIEYSLDKIGKGEVYVNRLLRYLLDPEEPHGLNEELLRAFLNGLPDESVDEWPFDEETYDLSRARVREQVSIPRVHADESGSDGVSTGRLDLLIDVPNEWFVLIELKFGAPETGTEFYYRADEIGDHDKTEYESGQYYLFLHDRRKPQASEPNFLNLTWTQFVDHILQPFLEANHQRYPHRTVVQLHEFIDDIQTLTDMTDHQATEQEKIELYLEHVEAIDDVSDTFDDRWERFTSEWPVLLADALGDSEHCTSYATVLPDRMANSLEKRGTSLEPYGAVEIDGRDLWIFQGTHSDWATLFREGWWIDEHSHEPKYDRDRGDDDLRIGFVHRMGKDSNRTRAIQDQELVFYFRNMGANPKPFRDAFTDNFEERKTELAELLPNEAEITGNKRNMIEAIYEIRVDEHDDFFDAYIAAVERAFRAHVVDNQELITALTEIYQEST